MSQLTGPEHPEGNESSVIRVLLDGTLEAQERYRVLAGGAAEAAEDDARYVPDVAAAYRACQPLALQTTENATWSVTAPSIGGTGWQDVGSRDSAESWLRANFDALAGGA